MTQPAPAKRSITSVSALAEHYIVPVPKVQDGVCATCHSVVYDGWETCFACNSARRILGDLALDTVAFVTLAPVGEQMAHDLFTYKRPSVPPHLRRTRTVLLAAILWRWLSEHEECLAAAAGIQSERFDIITSVPSASGRAGTHPVTQIVSGIVTGTAERYREVLRLIRGDIPSREVARDRFVATTDLSGQNVLLIDDTWTTGAKMQSASAALKIGGATRVGGLAIGRWFKNGYRDNTAWLREVRRSGWSWDSCCLEP
jgi:hypothetical protein